MNLRRFVKQFSPTEWRVVSAAFSRPVGMSGIPEFRELADTIASDLQSGERFICLKPNLRITSLQGIYFILAQKDNGLPPRMITLYAEDPAIKLPALFEIYREGIRQVARNREVAVALGVFALGLAITSPLLNGLPLLSLLPKDPEAIIGAVVFAIAIAALWGYVMRRRLADAIYIAW